MKAGAMPEPLDIKKLIGQMTLEEKAGQLNLLHGVVGANLEAVRRGEVSGFLFGPPRWERIADFSWADETNALQREAVERSRLGIPLIFSRDVIHGHRTVFPIPLGQAAAFNTELARGSAEIAAREASAEGVRWNYSPMVDIGRDPRWGRVAEGYGEDSYLASQMAAAVVQGYQGDDLSLPERIAACVKHFVGYGAAEGGRDYDSAELSDKTLREVYLPPFYAALEAGAVSLMAGIHDLNGVPMCSNRELLLGLLREEWGFQGLIVSDWGIVADLLKHRTAEDEQSAVKTAVDAGIEMDMVSGLYVKWIPELVRSGVVAEDKIDFAVRRVLELKAKLGLFDRPYADPAREKSQLLTPAHRAVARLSAQQAVVLLENKRNLLPLSPQIGCVAVVGPLADAKAELLGTWALDGRGADAVSIVEGIRAAVAPSARVIFEGGSAETALCQAQESEVVVLVLGEHPTRSGEAASVSDISLPFGQLELLERLAQFGVPIVTVVLAGRALAIEPVKRLSTALLYVFHPGVEGGNAIADLIFGKTSPSAKLPVSLPRSGGQIPIYYSRRSTGRPAQKETRYSSKYIDLPFSPLYPFGYGLNYGDFRVTDLTLDRDTLYHKEMLSLRVNVTNSGPRTATEVVQLYLRDEVRSVAPPEWELKRFERITLAPAAAAELVFTLSADDLQFWSPAARGWIAEPGTFTCRVGIDGPRSLTGSFLFAARANH